VVFVRQFSSFAEGIACMRVFFLSFFLCWILVRSEIFQGLNFLRIRFSSFMIWYIFA
jgi:hypothetical protein